MSVGKLPPPADVIPFEVWSGGQTGADRGALEGAQGTCLKTGGFAPRDWLTENGPAPELGTKFGLQECYEDENGGYPARTKENVLHCDATVIIAKNPYSRGTELTQELCAKYGKPCYVIMFTGDKNDPMVNVDHEAYYLAWWLLTFPDLKRVNFAGNRESKAPGIQTFTRWVMIVMGSLYRDRYWMYRDRQPPFPGTDAQNSAEPPDPVEIEEEEAQAEDPVALEEPVAFEEIEDSEELFSPEDETAFAPSGEDNA